MNLRVVVATATIMATVCAGEAHEIYISNEKDNTVSVIDSKTMDVVRTVKVGARPRGITFSRDQSVYFVCASDADAVQVYDAKTDTKLHDLPSGSDPEQFVLSSDGKRLFIANEDNAVTTIVDVEKRQVFK